jgi:hypothetical protein
MPAKKNSKRRTDFDIQIGFAAHVAANRQAHEWAEKCLAYRAAGKAAQAAAAERKAKHWLRKMMALEDLAGHGKPAGGRAIDSI